MTSWAITAMLCLGVYLAFVNEVRGRTCNDAEIEKCRPGGCLKKVHHSCDILCIHRHGGQVLYFPNCSPNGQECGISGEGVCKEYVGPCGRRCNCIDPVVEYR